MGVRSHHVSCGGPRSLPPLRCMRRGRRRRRLRHFCALNPNDLGRRDGWRETIQERRRGAPHHTGRRRRQTIAGTSIAPPSVRPSVRRPRARALLRKVQERRADRCRRTQWPESGRASGRRGGERCETGRGREGARSRGEEGEREERGEWDAAAAIVFVFSPGEQQRRTDEPTERRRDALFLLPAALSIARRVANRVTPHPAYSIAPSPSLLPPPPDAGGRLSGERPAYSNRRPKREIVCSRASRREDDGQRTDGGPTYCELRKKEGREESSPTKRPTPGKKKVERNRQKREDCDHVLHGRKTAANDSPKPEQRDVFRRTRRPQVARRRSVN